MLDINLHITCAPIRYRNTDNILEPECYKTKEISEGRYIIKCNLRPYCEYQFDENGNVISKRCNYHGWG